MTLESDSSAEAASSDSDESVMEIRLMMPSMLRGALCPPPD